MEIYLSLVKKMMYLMFKKTRYLRSFLSLNC
nr:unnamed protein product [Callosobruchus chinensis]